MKIIKGNYIPQNHLNAFIARINQITSKYNIQPIETLEISKRFKTSGARYNYSKNRLTGAIFDTKIVLAYNNYEEFGFDNMMMNLNHELAHHIATVKYDSKGHCSTFKKLCVGLGGHMNERLAGKKYKENATANFCASTGNKYRYTCECGVYIERKRLMRMNTKTFMYSVCNKCRFPLKNWKVTKIDQFKGWSVK